MIDKRTNLLKALRREKHSYTPYHLTLCDSLITEFKKQTGHTDYEEYFELPLRYVCFSGPVKLNDYSKYYEKLPTDVVIDEWGVGHIPGSIAHFTRMLHPMEKFVSPAQVLDYPYPDILSSYRWKDYSGDIQKLHEKGLASVFFAIQIFEPAWYLRGLDNLLMDMMTDDEMAGACIDRMTEFAGSIAKKAAAGGADIIVFGDDVGAQEKLMMSPGLWRRWLKPAMAHAISCAKRENPDVLAYYHSDGVIYDIIPELIEIGVDILNPVQPECMDPVLLKRMYGGRLSFWGTIGTQTTMPFGTPDEVRVSVREMKQKVGAGGGLVVAPTHLLEPEVPWENIIAFIEAAKEK